VAAWRVFPGCCSRPSCPAARPRSETGRGGVTIVFSVAIAAEVGRPSSQGATSLLRPSAWSGLATRRLRALGHRTERAGAARCPFLPALLIRARSVIALCSLTAKNVAIYRDVQNPYGPYLKSPVNEARFCTCRIRTLCRHLCSTRLSAARREKRSPGAMVITPCSLARSRRTRRLDARRSRRALRLWRRRLY
jgi:hypothetical protein